MQGTKEKYNNFSLIDEKTLIQISAQVSLYQRDIPLATLPKTVSSITLYILTLSNFRKRGQRKGGEKVIKLSKMKNFHRAKGSEFPV